MRMYAGISVKLASPLLGGFELGPGTDFYGGSVSSIPLEQTGLLYF